MEDWKEELLKERNNRLANFVTVQSEGLKVSQVTSFSLVLIEEPNLQCWFWIYH